MLLPALVLLAAAPAPIRLAAPEWTTVNMSAELGSFYAEEFARALRSEGLEVITAKDIQTLLGVDRQRQLLGCSESSCIAELGSALGCERVLNGQLAQLDDTFRGTLRVMSSVSGLVLAEEPVEAKGQKALVSALERAARRMAKKLKPPPPPPNLTWVPVVSGGSAVVVGGAIFFGAAGSNASKISAQSDENVAIGLAKDGKAFETTAWIMAGVGTAAIVTGVVMAVTGFPPPKVTPTVNVTSTSASVGVTGVFP